MKKSRSAWLVVGCALLALASFLMWLTLPFYSIRQFDAGFRQIHKGMDESAVVALMSNAYRQITYEHQIYWDEQPLDEVTSKSVRKSIRFTVSTFYLPVSFEVNFDANGKVIGKHRYD